jgi:NAD+ synthase
MTDSTTTQQCIATALGVVPEIDAAAEAERRIAFLADYVTGSGASGYVLGISGGVDSTVTGRLTQLACERAGKTFTAVRLPHGVQADEADAQQALAFIAADELVTVDIQPAVEPLHAATTPPGGYADAAKADFVKGNIKARIRMTAQYAVAGGLGALVVGTDHAAEAVMGFFTKHGDGAADITPLAGLTKEQVRQIGRRLGAPEVLVAKVPTADLEEDRPQLPDETSYGITYAEIDGYLTGHEVSEHARTVIESAYARTAHKRALPVAPVAQAVT